mmetsp:Transcript_1891/g.4342  ORF Transcript_1891/g.4342 Transcript_1891/m.4342 type:complete len:205 (-) Transcript_1891:116-730(-)
MEARSIARGSGIVAYAAAFAPGPAMLRTQASTRSTSCDVTMQMDRRAVVSAGILAVPSAAFATIGDAPKQAYFGAKPMSAPFGEVYGQTGAPLWEKLGETEKGIYERILSTSRESLRKVETEITSSSWVAARAALRMDAYEVRKAMVRINEASGSPEAKKLYEKFKRQIEALDLALVKKDGAASFKARAAAEITFGEWASAAGL